MKVYVFTVISGISDLTILEVFQEPQPALARFLSYLDFNSNVVAGSIKDYQDVIQYNSDTVSAYEKTDDDTIEVTTIVVK